MPDQAPARSRTRVVQHRLLASTSIASAARAALDDLDLGEFLTDAQIVVSELATNAVRHGMPFDDGCVAMRIAREDWGVRMEITDARPYSRPVMIDKPPDRDGGRGLDMIDRLSTAWGFRSARTTTFWAEFSEVVPESGPTKVLAACRRLLTDETRPPVELLLEAAATRMRWSVAEFRPSGSATAAASAGLRAPTTNERNALDGACAGAVEVPTEIEVSGASDVAVAVPVTVADQLLGVIGVVGPDDTSEDALELAHWIAGIVGPALVRESDRTSQDHLVDQLTFLARATEALGSSLDHDKTLQDVARLLVPARADWCTINLLNDDGSIRRVAAEHSDPRTKDRLHELLDSHPHDPDADTGVPLAIKTGQALLFPEVSQELLEETANDPEYLEITRDLAIRSCIIAPLEARGSVLGTISLVSTDLDRLRYDESDLALIKDLARRAAVAIDNARIHTSTTEVARALQQTLLPTELPTIPGMNLAARYVPSNSKQHVGGDFYDVVEAEDGSWYVIIGDVQGKGVKAATLIGLARHTLRSAILRLESPAAALKTLNRALNAASTDRSCTAVCVRAVPDDRTWNLTIARAGHPEPLMVAKGSVEPVSSRGVLLGVMDDVLIEEAGVELSPATSLVLFTDGAIGTDGGAEITLRRSLEAVASLSADGIADSIAPAVVDDLAVLVLQ
ncbi:MAG: SpoIIE family protein phosphatase, partial [Acidimicrobiia bacterium]|nr:SpoIIE family protein phosphatase [Acidimicrobiia bacterium]